MPFPMMQKLVDEMSPDGTHNYWRSTFIRALSDEVIDLIIEHGNRMEPRLSRIVIQFFGGAAAESVLPIRRLPSGKQSIMSGSRHNGSMQPKAKSTSAGRAPCRM